MRVVFFDRQNVSNPMNGKGVTRGEELIAIFKGFLNRDPSFCELHGANGEKELIGVGERVGCVQHSAIEGNPPYLMALSSDPDQPGYHEFLITDTSTPVSNRYCLPMDKVISIACYFLETGKRDTSVLWEEV